jgi:type VII secretion-associated serine protease mycosin
MRKLVVLAASVLLTLGPSSAAMGESVRDQQYWLDDYGFTSAWESSQGEGVKIAIIDTGIDSTHPSLQGAVVGGTDMSGLGSTDGQQPVGSNSYHGTMVASIAAGRGESEIIGVAPKAELLSVSIAFGVEGLDTDSQIADGIIWAVDNGAQVINLSLTRNSVSWPESWDQAFLYAFENDVVVVAAAGNRIDGTEQVSAPASIPGVISVAGLDLNGLPSENFSTDGLTIGVTAPAEELIGAFPGGEYRMWSGTSGATPIVSGMVALIRSMYPEMDAANVVNRVISSASKNGFEGYSTSYGHGVIDANRALLAEIPPVTENPLGSLEQWIELYRASTDKEAAPGDIVSPIQAPTPITSFEEPITAVPWYADISNWLPLAGYAGLGLLATFLYFAFRPAGHSPEEEKRK